MQPKGQPRTAGAAPAEPAHAALAELAKRQYGVVSIEQLLGPLGYSRGAVTRAAAARHLHRLHRSVYAVGHTDLSLHGRCLAAVLASGPDALLSHRSAAWLWGIARWSPIPVSVTSPSPRGPRAPIRLHRSRILTADDRDAIDGIPVTAVPRVALDLAAELRPAQLLRLLERAEELHLFDLRRFEDLLRRAGGHHGARCLGRALEIYRPAPFSRSGLERRFRELVLEAGLPRPVMGFVEAGCELDVYWPEERFAVELDVYETHGSRQSFEDDRVRQEDLKLAGVEMTRVTGHRLDREPKEVIQRVTRLLQQRREQRRPSGAVEV
ncbi:MAG TPA: type IV toxin-antitoxin system AbiEi family antitoxin domain-containing protein [Solirubrobacterales bacterium]|nr:type IV toxin-antitoxin system AbiEi family antitoxin domain-containing protein [Solirubrobacterales bacterium]